MARRLRKHWVFLVALSLGMMLRIAVTVAYRPALLFNDSFFYLERAVNFGFSPKRPVGYSVLLRPFALSDSLGVVAALQHLAGLGLAVACYLFLRRRGLPSWGATLAVLPLLLYPLQLVLEHYLLSDVLFESLLVAACLSLLWRARPRPVAVVTCGLMVGLAGDTRLRVVRDAVSDDGPAGHMSDQARPSRGLHRLPCLFTWRQDVTADLGHYQRRPFGCLAAGSTRVTSRSSGGGSATGTTSGSPARVSVRRH